MVPSSDGTFKCIEYAHGLVVPIQSYYLGLFDAWLCSEVVLKDMENIDLYLTTKPQQGTVQDFFP